MHPILWTMGSVHVRSYGLMLTISFVLGIAFALYRARKAGLDTYLVSNVCLLSLFASIIGSRLLYVWENRASYETNAFRTLTIWEGGLSMLGGVVLAIAVSFVYVKAKGASFRHVGDVLAPSVALGLFLTRIGCFLNGCCFGTVCELPWAVTFPRGSHAGDQFPGLHIHPTQLYSSAYGLALLGILLAAEKCRKGAGYLCGLFLVLYSTGRFLVEFLRYSEPSLLAFTVQGVAITRYQLICIGLFAMGWYFLLTAGSHPEGLARVRLRPPGQREAQAPRAPDARTAWAWPPRARGSWWPTWPTPSRRRARDDTPNWWGRGGDTGPTAAVRSRDTRS